MEFSPTEARLHALDYLQIIRNRFSIILLTFALVFITALAVTHILPEEYLGRATVEIVQDDSDLRLFQNGRVGDFASLNFIQTQFEVISSQQTLYRVVDDLDLVKRWNTGTRQGACGLLRKKLETSARRNTTLIDIEVYADSPEESAELANAVATSYAERRTSEEQQRVDKALGALREELDKQQERVEKQRAEMLRLMREHRVSDLAGYSNFNTNGEPLTATPSVLAASEQQLYKLQQEIEKLRSQLESLNALSGDDLIKMALSMEVADASIKQVYPQYLDETITLERMQNLGLGRRHPKVIAAQREIEKMREYLESGAVTIRNTLETQLQIASESLSRIETLHNSKENESMAEREEYVSYAEAKNEYNRQNQLLQAMETNYHEIAIEKNMTSTPTRIHELAEPNPVPARPNVLLNLVLGAIVGMGMGLALAFFLEYLDTSVKSIEDVETIMDSPVLAVIPKDVGLLLRHEGDSPDAEAYRILRTNIEFNRKKNDANVISVVSGSAGEGKSTTLANLAFVCAQGGYTTLLIDGDLRRPRLHTFFGVGNTPGLCDYLVDGTPLEEIVLRGREKNLWFLPSGRMPTDPAGILNSEKMTSLIQDMKCRFDVVLIDAPPILGVSDSAVLTREADHTIAVVQHRKLPRKTLSRVRKAIESAGGNLLGVILNNVDIRSDNQYQYYTSYYTYYSGRTEKSTPDKARAALSQPADFPANPPQETATETY